MWCPSVSLSVWANAWLAGAAAPDDVLDALSLWAQKHSVAAGDPHTACHMGLPWPGSDAGGTMALLQTLRTAAGRRDGPEPPVNVVLPVAGDVRGLPAGTEFARAALDVGEAIVVADEQRRGVGLVPEPVDDPARLRWTVHLLPPLPATEQHDLGAAELALIAAVRTAADHLAAVGTGYGGVAGGVDSRVAGEVDIADPRGQVQQVLAATRRHRAPGDAPSRALRVLENAAHVDAIITVSSGRVSGEVLRPLSGLVRSARIAAVATILHSAWRG